MKISERIRRANGEKPDYAIDDIGDIGYWQGMNDAALIAEAEELVQLSDDQQVVLEWLKEKTDSYPDVSYLIGDLNYFAVTPVGQAWKRLSKAEQFQVLAAFAEWGVSGD